MNSGAIESGNVVEKSCSNCGCFYPNTDGEIKETMDEAQIDCSLEQDQSERVCRFWTEVNQ